MRDSLRVEWGGFRSLCRKKVLRGMGGVGWGVDVVLTSSKTIGALT
jgi:hypothetical protein